MQAYVVHDCLASTRSSYSYLIVDMMTIVAVRSSEDSDRLVTAHKLRTKRRYQY